MNAWLWAYSDRLSVRPGEDVAFFAAGTGSTFDVEIARAGRAREVVWTRAGIEVGAHPAPKRADVNGCGWPRAFTLTIPRDWKSGYYDVVLTGADGARARHFLCVKAPAPSAPLVLVLATNTYHAYNWWGGANTYLWIGGPYPAPDADSEDEKRPAGRLSTQRPFVSGLMKIASERHRHIAEAVRGFGEPAIPGEIIDVLAGGDQGWDCSAGFLDKWEHGFAAWAENAGYALDYLTDYDLEREPNALDGYRAVAFVGHSEYWSPGQRIEVERFVDAGGRAVILSGNTCYWQCRWEDDGRTYVAHKARAVDEDPAYRDASTRHLTSGLWSSPWTGKPEAELTGLSFLFGGYHRFAMCASRGAGGYTVWREGHWTLEGADLYWGDVFGAGARLIGYENDGCAFTIDEDGLPRAIARLGVPAGLEIIATAPCTLAEPPASRFSGLVPPEDWPTLTRAYAGEDSERNRARMWRGHAVMATFTRGRGEVFNSGTTEWAYALAAGDPFVDRITRNVLDRFLR